MDSFNFKGPTWWIWVIRDPLRKKSCGARLLGANTSMDSCQPINQSTNEPIIFFFICFHWELLQVPLRSRYDSKVVIYHVPPQSLQRYYNVSPRLSSQGGSNQSWLPGSVKVHVQPTILGTPRMTCQEGRSKTWRHEAFQKSYPKLHRQSWNPHAFGMKLDNYIETTMVLGIAF